VRHLAPRLVLVALTACQALDDPGSGDDDRADENPNGAGDRYQSFAELAAIEREGIDYRITVEARPAPRTVMAIHAGKIEFATTELARDVVAAVPAASGGASLYLFEGTKAADNGVLHITSRRFDEPRALALAAGSERCVSLHGFKNREASELCLGGLDEELKTRLGETLAPLAAAEGISVRTAGGRCDGFKAIEPENIVNRCALGGAQLEMSTLLRERAFKDPAFRARLADAIAEALASAP
jgi:phage replication-related protein YjqB (UPF0714/DUF867 family)